MICVYSYRGQNILPDPLCFTSDKYMCIYCDWIIMLNNDSSSLEDDQSILIKTSSCNQPVLFRTICYSKENFLHGVTTNSLYLSFSPCKATNLTTRGHRKQSLLIIFTMQSYKSYYMVSPQTVFTYPFHHAKLQILLHGVTANSLYLLFSPCKATNLTTWCHRKQSLLILFTMQSYKSYDMVSLQTVFTYPFHLAKLSKSLTYAN